MAAFLVAGLASACADAAVQGGAEAPLARMAQDNSLQWGACPPIFPEGCEIAILHGDPALPNADVFLRVPGGYAFPPHSHTSAERMILIAGELDVQYEGNPATTLSPGGYAYGPPGLPHRASCESDDACVLFIAFVGAVDAEPFTGSLE